MWKVNVKRQKSLWKNTDFLILWTGQTISTLGTTIDQLAYPLLILFITNSPFQAGIGTAFFTLPSFIFGLFAGALVDRWDRKKIAIICDIVRFIATASIPILAVFGYLNVFYIYLSAFIEGTCGVFFYAAITSAYPLVVGKEKLPEALSQNETSNSVASLIGPTIGGFLYQVIGKTIPYVADAVSYLISVISLLFIKVDFQEKKEIHKKDLEKEIKEGIMWIWKHPIIRTVSLLTAGGALVGSGQNLVIILVAKNNHISTTAIGIIFSIGAIGSILGALFAGQIPKAIKLMTVIIYARWLMAIVLPLYLFAHTTLVLGIITALYFFAGPVYGVLLSGYRIALTPDALQGRVNSTYRMITLGGYSLGGLLAGILLQYGGTTITIIIFSGILFFLAILASTSLSKDGKSYRK